MADVWHEYLPTESPTGDVWVNANVPVGDEWFDVHNDYTTDNIAWHIQNANDNDIAWHIQNEWTQNIAWSIFEAVIRYLALFRLQPLTSSFKLSALTSSYDIKQLQSAYTLLETLITQYGFEVPLIDSFDVEPQLDQTFEIDSEVPTTKYIQKNGNGTFIVGEE